MQHEAGPLNTPISTSTPAVYPYAIFLCSLPKSTEVGSRIGGELSLPLAPGLGGGFDSVGGAVQSQKEKINAHLMEDIKANVLDPTSKEAWPKLSSRSDTEHKQAPSSLAELLPKRKVMAPNPKLVEVTLVLVEDTKVVNQEKYPLPTATNLPQFT
ncbi:hypothetical protein K438DRAFT_1786666 [Mycena galopus ATCC 62051]|nr:hypothetical protein K438DRAFT_1786666 [Mycena galopus ATCC 62051]